jgi:hypothetical protein
MTFLFFSFRYPKFPQDKAEQSYEEYSQETIRCPFWAHSGIRSQIYGVDFLLTSLSLEVGNLVDLLREQLRQVGVEGLKKVRDSGRQGVDVVGEGLDSLKLDQGGTEALRDLRGDHLAVVVQDVDLDPLHLRFLLLLRRNDGSDLRDFALLQSGNTLGDGDRGSLGSDSGVLDDDGGSLESLRSGLDPMTESTRRNITKRKTYVLVAGATAEPEDDPC